MGVNYQDLITIWIHFSLSNVPLFCFHCVFCISAPCFSYKTVALVWFSLSAGWPYSHNLEWICSCGSETQSARCLYAVAESRGKLTVAHTACIYSVKHVKPYVCLSIYIYRFTCCFKSVFSAQQFLSNSNDWTEDKVSFTA